MPYVTMRSYHYCNTLLVVVSDARAHAHPSRGNQYSGSRCLKLRQRRRSDLMGAGAQGATSVGTCFHPVRSPALPKLQAARARVLVPT